MQQARAAPPAAGEVAPRILAAAKEIGRPHAAVSSYGDLSHLPGRRGWLAGLRHVVGVVRSGEAYFADLIQRYGKVFRTVSGSRDVVCVADPDLIWTIARNEDRAWSAALPWTYMLGGLLPGETADSLLTLDFEPHRDARRLLQPVFNAQAVAGYLDSARPIFDAAITDWLRRGRVPFKAAVRRLFATVSTRIFMGIEDPADAAMLDRAMTDGWSGILAIRKRSRLSPGWRRALRGADTLWSSLRPRMEERRRAGGSDLFSRLCQVRDDAAWLDDDARMRLFVFTMFAAFDTTASGAASMAHLLAKHPAWQERLRAEGRSLGKTDASPDELKVLEQHEWVWKETLRLYPVAGFMIRQALHDVTLGDVAIPASTFVTALSGSAGFDATHWTEPHRFDPERFSPSRAEDKRHKAIFLPFGAGPHSCIGAQLASVEIKAFWHALLSRCRIRLASDHEVHHQYTPIGIVSGDVEVIVDAA